MQDDFYRLMSLIPYYFSKDQQWDLILMVARCRTIYYNDLLNNSLEFIIYEDKPKIRYSFWFVLEIDS